MKIRVLLVDDHRLMIAGLRALLVSEPDIEVVGEASDGRGALDLMRTLLPDVVVMDIRMPELNGIEATRRIRAEYDGVRVIALSSVAEGREVLRMLEAGACGYVVKFAAHEELVRAVRAASLGRAYLSPEIAGAVVERYTRTRMREAICPPTRPWVRGNARSFSSWPRAGRPSRWRRRCTSR